MVFKYTQSVFLANSLKDFRALLEKLTLFLGMDGYTFFYLDSTQEVHLLDGRPQDFTNFYMEKDWLFFDPVVRTAFSNSRPILWNRDVKARTATQKVIYNAGVDAGICDGFNFQVKEELEKGGLSFYSSTVGKTTSEAFDEEKMSLQIFTQAFYLSFKNYLSSISEEELERQQFEIHNPLSEREGEILYLMAEGLQNAEISKRLNIATDTVKEHIGKISQKLKSKNRTHSVAIGLRNKFIIS